jgi:hypothetical protein
VAAFQEIFEGRCIMRDKLGMKNEE